MRVWAYYTTDGDAGWYGVTLFPTLDAAAAYLKKKNDAYGQISSLEMADTPHVVLAKDIMRQVTQKRGEFRLPLKGSLTVYADAQMIQDVIKAG
jgi:hypothetical protein